MEPAAEATTAVEATAAAMKPTTTAAVKASASAPVATATAVLGKQGQRGKGKENYKC